MVINTTAWATQPTDDTRMNRVTNISNTGTVLSGFDKTKFGLLICTLDGGGLLKDHVYLCDAAGTNFIDLVNVASHAHSSSSDGGDFANIILGNPKWFDLILTKITDLQTTSWNGTAVSGGTLETKTDGTTGERSLRLRTNLTNGGAYTINYPHLKLDFGKNALYQVKLQIETATSIALHTGVGADDVTAADSTTRKFQAEVCTVTNNNWWLRTANGSTQTASDTAIAITTNRVAIKMKHYPTAGTPVVQLFVDSGTMLEKSSNIPTSGATADINIIKHSVKNSTAADRPLLMYGTRLQYTVSDSWV